MKLLTEEELEKEIIEILECETSHKNTVANFLALVRSQKQAHGDDEVKRVKSQLNKVLFFETTNPKGYFIKECLLSDLDTIEAEQRERNKL